MANTRIGRTVSVAGSRRKATFSAWIKRTGLGEAWILSAGGVYGGTVFKLGFNSASGCFIVGPSSTPRIESNNLFRDTSGYYHYVVGIDTEQSVAANRLKFYINGVQVTSFSTETYPTLNQDLPINNTGSDNNMWVGGRGESTYEFNGIMSHVHWIDGTQYAASDFGETDATTGEWKIKTSPSVTYGENGFFVLKDGSSLTDASGEGNNLTLLVGTLTNTEDNPSDVFATFNPLGENVLMTGTHDLVNGNTTYDPTNTGNESWSASTLGAAAGKWYWEVKIAGTMAGDWPDIGFIKMDDISTRQSASSPPQHNTTYLGVYEPNGTKWIFGTQTTSWGSGYTAGDIIQCAVDCDNGKLWWGKNGTWETSGATGDPANGTNESGTFTAGTLMGPYVAGYEAGSVYLYHNFGNGYFGTTAISSEGTNASGIGKFEYDVPTGYTALSTKGLNS